MPSTEVLQKKLDARFSVKSVNDETGEFEGYASTFDLDQDGERIAKGAWRRTIAHSGGGVVPILFSHDVKEPCGWNYEAKEDDHGLWVRGKLAIETEIGRKAYFFLKGASEAGGKAGLSVGFRVIKSHWEKDPENKKETRVFDECALMEYSICVFQANLEAYVTEVKSQYEGETMDKKSAPTASVDGVEHPSSDFAYVPDPQKPSTWKFPIFNASHVRNALARWNQADIPEGDKAHVLARIHSAAHKFGIHVGGEDGKNFEADVVTKKAPVDFHSALSNEQVKRDMYVERNNIENALHKSLGSIHDSDLDHETKCSMIGKAYDGYGDAMTDWHRKAMTAADATDGGYLSGYCSASQVGITGKSDTDDVFVKTLIEVASETKGMLPAAKKAMLAHSMSLHHSAIDLHKKGIHIVKSLMNDDGSNTVDYGSDEMGTLADKQPIDTKSEEDAASAELAEYIKSLGENLKLAA